MPKKKSRRELVHEHLRKNGLSLKIIAGKIGIPDPSIRSWVARGKIPSKLAGQFAQELGITVETLIDWGFYYCRVMGNGQEIEPGLRLTKDELQILLRTHDTLGDLSIRMIVNIVRDQREKKD